MLYYKYCFNERNRNLIICNANEIQKGDIVITGDDSIKKIIEMNNVEVIQKYKQAIVYKIK